jgi:broad specificity phosphatase PhoE
LKKGFSYEEFKEVMMDALMEVENFEDHFDTFERAQAFKRGIQEYLKANPLSKGEKVAIVTHSMLISALTCSHVAVDEEGNQHFANSQWLYNC